MELLKVGDLAKRTGLSVRTLHHYEELGLLQPTQRTASGHRLYCARDIEQLHKILALKQLGMSLERIAEWLQNGHRFGVLDAVRLQRAHVRGQISMLSTMERRLENVEKRMSAAGDNVSIDDVLGALETIAMIERYYTEEQLQQLEQRRKDLGEDTIKSVEQEWPQLIAKVRDAMSRGLDPKSAEVKPLLKRWQELVEMFTGGDPGIAASLKKMYANEPSVQQRSNLDGDLMAYVQKGWDA